jgi:hypothetical protein
MPVRDDDDQRVDLDLDDDLVDHDDHGVGRHDHDDEAAPPGRRGQ